jgi:dolichol-phosphate mannosyltransferase
MTWSLLAWGAATDAALSLLLLFLGATPVVAGLCGFAGGCICWLIAINRGVPPSRARTASVLFLLGVIYFVRAGLLGSLLKLLHFAPGVAVLLAIAVTILSVLVVKPVHRQLTVSPIAVATQPVVLFLLFSALVLRLLWAGTLDLLPHEAYYFGYAQHLDIGYLDHPPMVAWLIALGTRFFGWNEFGVRILSLVPWLIMVGFTYRLTASLYSRATAMAACGILVCLPYYFFGGIFVSPDSALMAAWAASLYCVHRALRGDGGRYWLYFGIAVGLGMLSKYSMVLVAMTTGLLLVFHQPYRRFLRSPYLYGGGCLALLVFSPVLYWNATHDWASFAFQTSRRASSLYRFSLHLTVAYVVCLITPLGVYAVIREFTDWRLKPAATTTDADRRRFVFFFTLVPFSAFALFSVLHIPKLNWTGPCFLAAVPMLGAQVVNWQPGQRGRLFDWTMRAWTPFLMGVLVVAGLVFHYDGLGIPGVSYPRTMTRFLGWRSLGESVRDMARAGGAHASTSTIIVGMDRHIISSQLAFYVPDGKRGEDEFRFSGRHVFGVESLMWKTWGEQNVAGKRFIMIGTRPQLTREGIEEYFESLSPVEPLQAYTNGKKSSVYFCRVGYGFRDRHANSRQADGAKGSGDGE